MRKLLLAVTTICAMVSVAQAENEPALEIMKKQSAAVAAKSPKYKAGKQAETYEHPSLKIMKKQSAAVAAKANVPSYICPADNDEYVFTQVVYPNGDIVCYKEYKYAGSNN